MTTAAAAVRLPLAVLIKIFQQAVDIMTREKYCCRFSLVHRTWTVAAQTVLWSEVMLWDPKRIKLAIDSPALGRHSVKRLTLMGGRGTRKVSENEVGELVAKIGSVEQLTIQSISNLNPNSFFGVPALLSNLSSFEVNMAIKDLPKTVAPIQPPSRIPLRWIKLGSQSIALGFLGPLLAASTATLQSLTITLNTRTTPNLIRACPVALPHITKLNVEALRNELTSVEYGFFPLLAGCAKLRSLGWEWNDYFELDGALHHLPDRGARLEHIGISVFGVREQLKSAVVTSFVDRPGLAGLRQLRVVGLRGNSHHGDDATQKEVEAFCRRRRIALQCR